MNRQEATQHAVSGIGVMEGVSLDFGQVQESPCQECNVPVSLNDPIEVHVTLASGRVVTRKMFESDARGLLMQVGITPPVVMCHRHVHLEVGF